jgi:uncharacterized protein YacL
MTLLFIRIFFFILSGVVGYYVGWIIDYPVLGTEIGMVCGLLLIFLERRLQSVSVRGLSSMVFGLLLGVFMAKLISDIIALLPLAEFMSSISRVTLTLIFSYLGAVMALRGKDEFNIIIPYVRFRRQDVKDAVVLLDTSAIIDGRTIDVYKTNFLAGRLVVPKFVVRELQRLADSADDIKRQRGRRGLDILHMMMEDPKLDVRIHDDETPETNAVDLELIRLAKIMDGRICTTDYNLGKTASLEDVVVLNLNELAHAVKAVVFQGEKLDIKLVKEGKEHGQAVGYLDDGTMVVVSDARDQIGNKVTVDVSSVLQTQAGKMVFAKLAR